MTQSTTAKLAANMSNHLVKSLAVGLARRWRTGLTQAFGVAGTIWLITEIVTRVSRSANDWLTGHGDATRIGAEAPHRQEWIDRGH